MMIDPAATAATNTRPPMGGHHGERDGPGRLTVTTEADVVYELLPLFDVSQPTLSHHLKKLRDAGIVDSERQGLWVYYYVRPDALRHLAAWLG